LSFPSAEKPGQKFIAETPMPAEWVDTPQFASVFDANIALLTETRDYLQHSLSLGHTAAEDPIAKLTATREASRLTALLAETMSWLLLNKAVNNHEVPLDSLLEEAANLCRNIGARDEDAPKIVAELPEELEELYSKSLDLFVSVRKILANARAATN
jgi:hypothetical protein